MMFSNVTGVDPLPLPEPLSLSLSSREGLGRV